MLILYYFSIYNINHCPNLCVKGLSYFYCPIV